MKRRWIPPWALAFAHLSNGASWVILAWAALRGPSWTIDLPAIAWIHTVALGFATTAALAVLVHAIPAFTDVRWRFETLARVATGAFAAGVAAFVASAIWNPQMLERAAGIVVLGLIGYCVAAIATLAQTANAARRERAIGRAMTITFVFLLLTGLIGAALASILSGHSLPGWIAALPASHASLGIFGWLTLLIFGVSARTLRPIAGEPSRFPVAHILVGSLGVAGVVLLALGLGGVTALVWPGAVLLTSGALVYAVDTLDVLRRARVPHRPPQAFIAAAVVWLLLALAFGCAALLGAPLQLAFGFTILAGWIGQMLAAHIHHIGVRLLLTMVRGENDETRPGDVLDARVSWATFGLLQLAVGFGAVALAIRAQPLLTLAAALGCVGWACMTANLTIARARAVTFRSPEMPERTAPT